MAKFFGGILMVAGFLIAASAGLCAAGGVLSMMNHDTPLPELLGGMGGVLLFAAVPIVGGCLLFVGGRRLFRGSK